MELKVDKNVTPFLLNNLGFNDTNLEFHSEARKRGQLFLHGRVSQASQAKIRHYLKERVCSRKKRSGGECKISKIGITIAYFDLRCNRKK